ncbi:MarR family winged helix-turn-helix transcriptional regulator [Streptomyces boluensis]|uniref:MarR family transcriptional regulator n=1 Tax=Streptomyces boluensis TaxID=1775135 RepID=A0A964UL71_9ACTN|nr:MarR family winged helix-turn-helix transcriptional regulator [Streptomyces boluensis]NBE50566.1 MarR family transcriptional regulator [Streptomyces boluensis]
MTDQKPDSEALEAALRIDMYQQPGHLIRRAQQVHTSMWVSLVSAEVTSTQFAVLSAVAEEPETDQNSISRRVSLDTSTVAEVVNRLAARGYLTRTKDTVDRRRNLLSLSPDGVRLFTEVSRAAAAMTDRLVEILPDDDRKELVRILQNLVESGEAIRDATPPGGDRA